LIGHSEGGVVAPLVASRSKDVAYIVLLAAPGMTGEDVLVQQLGATLAAEGVSEVEIAKARERQRRILAIVKEETDEKAMRERLLEHEREEIAKLSEKDRQEYLKLAAQVAMAKLEMLATPSFRSFLRHDPQPVLANVTCPVLALNGGKDVQVAPKENLGAIAKALKDAGNTDATVKELAGLNHLFQRSGTGAVSEYGRIEETFAPQALEEVSQWIAMRIP
jgi:pimeloyl-ACP methyl ester carboxylesterase